MRLRRLMEMGRRARCWREARMEPPSRLIFAGGEEEGVGREGPGGVGFDGAGEGEGAEVVGTGGE